MSDENQTIASESILDLPVGLTDGFIPPQATFSSHSLEDIIALLDQSVDDQRLAGRAKTAATATGQQSQAQKTLATQGKYIIFSLAETKYAVPINQVMEVGEPQRITPVPNVPTWVLGVTNLRGEIISVVDCGAFLNLPEKLSPEISSVCVVRNKRRDLMTSLVVDQIEGMMSVSEDLISLPEMPFENRVEPYLHGVYEQNGNLLNILNLEGLLSSMALIQ